MWGHGTHLPGKAVSKEQEMSYELMSSLGSGATRPSTRGVWGPGLYSWGTPYQTYRSDLPSRYVPAFGDGEGLAPPGTGPIAETASDVAALGAGVGTSLALNFVEGAVAGAVVGGADRKKTAVWGGTAAALSSPLSLIFNSLGTFGVVLNLVRPFAAGVLAAKYLER